MKLAVTLLLALGLPLEGWAAGPGREAAPPSLQAEGGASKGRGAVQAEAPASIDTLRSQCYGGRQKELPRLALEQLITQARSAALKHQLDQVESTVRRILQGGGDEQRFIPTYGMTLEERNASTHDRWKAKRCHELLGRLAAAEGKAKAGKKGES